MAGPLQRVLMRSAASAMPRAKASEWHYGPGFDPQKAAAQHQALTTLILASGAEIEWLTDADDGLADSVFTHDPSLMTDHGAIILAMGKALRLAEPGLHEAAYNRMGVPILGRIEYPGQVEGGDCVWVDSRTLAVGRGVRTNQDGIQQLANLLTPKGIQVYGYDLPLWHGEEACLHLMSVISPLADDLALVYAPLLPAAFYQMLRARGIRLVEGDAEEFFASNGLSLN
ncbi:MAG: amidinotransferase, partial [Mesorhizobium sp.]